MTMGWQVKRNGQGFVAVLGDQVGKRMVEELNRMEGFATAEQAWKAVAEREQEAPSHLG